MQKVLITGSTGLVGSRVVELLKGSFEFIPLTQSQCDITDTDEVHTKLSSLEFDTVLHLAAYTNVDGAEKERETAHAINVLGTENLYSAAISDNKKFVYVSTDFVFDGKQPPYTEVSVPNPIGYYGQTKYEGERIVADRGMIVRISYPYRKLSPGKPDFVARLGLLLQEHRTLSMVTDSTFTPTYIDDIALGLGYLLKHGEPTVYHLVGTETLTPFDAGIRIARSYGYDESLIIPTTYREYYAGKALRPQFGEVKSTRNNFQPMHGFGEGLKILTQK